MDWRNSMRAAVNIRRPEDKANGDRGIRVLECVKSNYAPLGKPVRLEWTDGVLTVEGSTSPLRQAAQDAQAEHKFLDLLDQRVRLGRDVSDKPGRNYAPVIFAELEESGGYSNTPLPAPWSDCSVPGGSRLRR